MLGGISVLVSPLLAVSAIGLLITSAMHPIRRGRSGKKPKCKMAYEDTALWNKFSNILNE